MFKIDNISKSYIDKFQVKTNALNNISLTFAKTGMIFILGKSGSGKSTLLNILSGIDKANKNQGNILVANSSISDLNQRDLDNYRNGMIGFIFQEFNLIEDMNVFENIKLSLSLQRKNVDVNLVDSLLKELDLDNSIKTKKIYELSGGQKQRVGIIRCLIKNPRIVLADEPTGNLDNITGKQVFDKLKSVSSQKLVIIISHDEENAFKYADRIIRIKDGRIEDDLIKKTNINNDNISKKTKFKVGSALTEEMLEQLEQNNNFSKNIFKNFEKNPNVIYPHFQINDFNSLPSRLDFKNIFRMGINCFKNRKLSLAIIIFIFWNFFHSFIFENLMIALGKAEINNKLSLLFIIENLKNIFFTMSKEIKIIFILLYMCIWLIPFFLIKMYFNISIRFKKREIGILRSLGSNGVNIAKIFLFQCFVFAFIATLFSFCLSSFSSNYVTNLAFEEIFPKLPKLNFLTYFKDDSIREKIKQYYNYNHNIEMLVFFLVRPIKRIFSLLIYTFIYTIIFSLMSIFLPIMKLIKQKPIDIINDK